MCQNAHLCDHSCTLFFNLKKTVAGVWCVYQNGKPAVVIVPLKYLWLMLQFYPYYLGASPNGYKGPYF